MQVYLLFGYVKWEGEDVLGVYSSKENAEKAWEEYNADVDDENYKHYHKHYILPMVVDSVAG